MLGMEQRLVLVAVWTLHGGFYRVYPNSWMVYSMENPRKVDDLGVPPWIGNLQMIPNLKEPLSSRFNLQKFIHR